MQKLGRWQYIVAGLIAALAAIVFSRLLIDRETERMTYEIVWFVIFMATYFVVLYIQQHRSRRGHTPEL